MTTTCLLSQFVKYVSEHPGDAATWFQGIVSIVAIVCGALAIKWQVEKQHRSDYENSMAAAMAFVANLTQALQQMSVAAQSNDKNSLETWLSTLSMLIDYGKSTSIQNLDRRRSWEYLQALSKASQFEQRGRIYANKLDMTNANQAHRFFDDAYLDIKVRVDIFDTRTSP